MKRLKLYENWIQELDKNGSNFLKKWVDLNKTLTNFVEERKKLLEEDLVFINDLLPTGNELSIEVKYNEYKYSITQPQFDISIGRDIEVDVETMKDILEEVVSYIRRWNNEYYITYRIMFEDKRHSGGGCWDITDSNMIEEIDWEDAKTIIINRIDITLW